ncbi:MAG TPA: type I secretion system permease/ATPase [Hyphomicrobiaceae bacterium]|nr:type I secretion system permease/ATPase [Hyphomicrobiaceae bacterium]
MMRHQSDPEKEAANPLSRAVARVRYALWGVGAFSLAINVLMLTGPVFMLQVYDRVLTSRSVPTLAALFGLAVALYIFFGVFELLRTRVLSRVGYRLDEQLMQPALQTWIATQLTGRPSSARPTNDLSALRMFMSSQGLPALFDLPWVPLYLGIVFLLHVQLGLLALGGAVVVVILAVANELTTRKSMNDAGLLENKETQFADQSLRSSEAIVSMGMTANVVQHWGDLRNAAKQRAQDAGDRSEWFAASSKAVRMLLQSALLGLGGYLAIMGKISPGTIVAASILAGRALSPIDQAIGNWRNILRARQAYVRLWHALVGYTGDQTKTDLPKPQGRLDVQKVIKLTDMADAAKGGARRPILHGVTFSLKAGDALGVIGPSGAGKSTLARMLVGLTMPDQGSVRLDGATFDQWDSNAVGRHIGYLPQHLELLPGSLKQNIARFDPGATDDEVIAAARLAGAHDLILKMPEGYATEIGFGRPPLSGGQAQRVCLARALFRLPPLVVLDEPSSNLDVDGDLALTHAIMRLRKAGSVVIVMTHRPGAIQAANLILMISDGRQVEFGEKNEVLRKVTRNKGRRPGPGNSKPENGNDDSTDPDSDG